MAQIANRLNSEVQITEELEKIQRLLSQIGTQRLKQVETQAEKEI